MVKYHCHVVVLHTISLHQNRPLRPQESLSPFLRTNLLTALYIIDSPCQVTFYKVRWSHAQFTQYASSHSTGKPYGTDCKIDASVNRCYWWFSTQDFIKLWGSKNDRLVITWYILKSPWKADCASWKETILRNITANGY